MNEYEFYFRALTGNEYIKVHGTFYGDGPQAALQAHANANHIAGERFPDWLVRDKLSGRIFTYTVTKGGWNVSERTN